MAFCSCAFSQSTAHGRSGSAVNSPGSLSVGLQHGCEIYSRSPSPAAVQLPFLVRGGNPFSTTSIYTLIHCLERRWKVYFPQGGTGALVQALVKLFLELGGRTSSGVRDHRDHDEGQSGNRRHDPRRTEGTIRAGGQRRRRVSHLRRSLAPNRFCRGDAQEARQDELQYVAVPGLFRHEQEIFESGASQHYFWTRYRELLPDILSEAFWLTTFRSIRTCRRAPIRRWPRRIAKLFMFCLRASFGQGAHRLGKGRPKLR
jgi:hypothetical protein